MFCSRRCRSRYWKRRNLHDAGLQEREDRRKLEQSREKNGDEKLNEENACHNCGRAPCQEDFYFSCSSSDYNNNTRIKGQLLPPDYWIPIGKVEIRERKGCYGCFKFKGTMLNVTTNKTVAICIEHQIQNAPLPSEGCDRPDYSLASPTSKRTQRRRRRRLVIPDVD